MDQELPARGRLIKMLDWNGGEVVGKVEAVHRDPARITVQIRTGKGVVRFLPLNRWVADWSTPRTRTRVLADNHAAVQKRDYRARLRARAPR